MSKRSVLAILGIVIIAAGFYVAFRVWAYPAVVTIVSQEETRNKVELSYPQMEGLPKGQVQERFNQALREEAEGFAAKLDMPNYSGKVSYKTEYNNHYLVSVTLTESFYMERAAHPMTFLRAFTMNTKTGEFYKLSDIFKPGAPYAEKINRIIGQQIAERHIFLLKPFTGIGDSQEFYLSADGLVIYYQLYEYTPYVYGFPKFVIPYAQISDMLNGNIEGITAN